MPSCALSLGLPAGGLSTTLLVISFATPSWMTNLDVSAGLWQACLNTTCVSVFDNNSDILHIIGDWLRICQMCGVLGLIICLIGMICTCGFIVSQNPTLLRFASFNMFFSMIIYGFMTAFYAILAHSRALLYNGSRSLWLGPSFWAAVSAVLLGHLAAVLLLTDYRKKTEHKLLYTRLN